ncbi:putative serine/threonine-protein kinase [Hypsibius exemplaris]|uniref:Serine/threonine-protein kinase n=1 Tax=Hypsibius exemplaris TaxID=2072580 RepID=A0A9X6NI63_HYPEX|nr:putative serine/threonine-protein kinase [Hypsibius exemplaris]
MYWTPVLDYCTGLLYWTPDHQPSFCNSQPESGKSRTAAIMYKKDGSLDMRYSSSRAAVAAGSGSGLRGNNTPASFSSNSSSNSHTGYSSGYSSSPSPSNVQSSSGGNKYSGDLHYKKDGSLDMRYNSSQQQMATPSTCTSSRTHSSDYTTTPIRSSGNGALDSATAGLVLKKDGTPDMRYTSSRQALATDSYGGPSSSRLLSTPQTPPGDGLHRKKDGSLDMRYRSSKDTPSAPQSRYASCESGPLRAIAAGMAKMAVNGGRLPCKKDGTLDMRFKACKDAVDAGKVENAQNARDSYWQRRLAEERFAREWQQQRDQMVVLPLVVSFREQTVECLRRELQAVTHVQTVKEKDTAMVEESAVAIALPGDIHEIPYESLKFNGTESGKGAFGVVLEAEWNSVKVAVKKLFLSSSQLKRSEKKDFEREVCILARLGRHPNLTEFYGYCLEPPCIVMEFIELGNLGYLLHYCKDASVEAKMSDGRVKRNIMIGIADGMAVLHSVQVVHGDIKPPNILITEDYTAKIADFGLARLRGKTASLVESSKLAQHEVAGTSGYMAPELLDSSSPPDYNSDVYAFGVLLNEVVTEEEPYSDQLQNFRGRGPFGAVNYAKSGNRPKIRSGLPNQLVGLIVECWNGDAKKRPSFVQVQASLRQADFVIPDWKN